MLAVHNKLPVENAYDAVEAEVAVHNKLEAAHDELEVAHDAVELIVSAYIAVGHVLADL